MFMNERDRELSGYTELASEVYPDAAGKISDRFTATVYALTDPRKTDPLAGVFYTGSTTHSPGDRRSKLIYESRHTMCQRGVLRRIRELDEAGVTPGVQPLYCCEPEVVRKAEEELISVYGTQVVNYQKHCNQPLEYTAEAKANLQGEMHPRAKLTNEQVHEIRNKYSTGFSSEVELAEHYSISQSEIGHIVHNGRWHDDEYDFKNTLPAIEKRFRKARGRLIRSLYHSGMMTQVELASTFGIDQGKISKIVRGKLWADYSTDPDPSIKASVTSFEAVRTQLITRLNEIGTPVKEKLFARYQLDRPIVVKTRPEPNCSKFLEDIFSGESQCFDVGGFNGKNG